MWSIAGQRPDWLICAYKLQVNSGDGQKNIYFDDFLSCLSVTFLIYQIVEYYFIFLHIGWLLLNNYLIASVSVFIIFTGIAEPVSEYFLLRILCVFSFAQNKKIYPRLRCGSRDNIVRILYILYLSLVFRLQLIGATRISGLNISQVHLTAHLNNGP